MNRNDKKRVWNFFSEVLCLDPRDDSSEIEVDFGQKGPEHSDAEDPSGEPLPQDRRRALSAAVDVGAPAVELHEAAGRGKSRAAR
jgi:hypothetical protein